MATETKRKEQQWKDHISLSSSSRSSSITSDGSDGHFDIRHFPLPKPSLSASEAQKQRETHQAYNSSMSSYAYHNNLVDFPGYDSNRIPSSIFSSKPANSTEWSTASNESLFSIHDGSFSISIKEDHGLAAALRSDEIPKFEERVQEITEINPVPLFPVNKQTESEKATITEKKPYQVENSHSEIDDNKEEEMIEHEEEEEEDMIKAEVLVETETEKQEEKEEVEDVKDNKQEDSNSIVSHSPSVSCRSDTSNNSNCSFAFPEMQKEEVLNKTPSMETKGNVSYLLPQSPMQPPQPQQQPFSESQPIASKQFESQSKLPKASRKCWLSCFQCPSKCGLFK